MCDMNESELVTAYLTLAYFFASYGHAYSEPSYDLPKKKYESLKFGYFLANYT